MRYRGARGNQPLGSTLGDRRAPAGRCETRCCPDWQNQESPGSIRAECQYEDHPGDDPMGAHIQLALHCTRAASQTTYDLLELRRNGVTRRKTVALFHTICEINHVADYLATGARASAGIRTSGVNVAGCRMRGVRTRLVRSVG